MHCSYCGEADHNIKGCKYMKASLPPPNAQAPPPPSDDNVEASQANMDRSRLREQTRRARVSTGPNPIRRESSRMNRDKERGETKGAGRPAGILLQKCSGHRSLSGKGFSGGADIGGGDSEVGLRFSLSAFYARTCCSSCLLA